MNNYRETQKSSLVKHCKTGGRNFFISEIFKHGQNELPHVRANISLLRRFVIGHKAKSKGPLSLKI